MNQSRAPGWYFPSFLYEVRGRIYIIIAMYMRDIRIKIIIILMDRARDKSYSIHNAVYSEPK